MFFKNTILRKKADRLRDQKAWAQAAAAYSEYLARVPRDGAIWVQYGHALKEAGSLAPARTAYETAFRFLPEDLDLALTMGHFFKRLDEEEEALTHFSRAVSIDPSCEEAVREACALGGKPKGGLVDPDRDRLLNVQEAADHLQSVLQSAEALEEFRSQLPTLPADAGSGGFPRALHFVFGFKQRGDIPYYGMVAILSALHFNPGWSAFYYTMHEPAGPNWNRVKEKISMVLLRDFEYFGKARLHHYAHKADVIRMIVLNALGGVYLDLDSITCKSFEDLRSHDFVMGVQAAGPHSSSGLCNAIMMGKPAARFSTLWISHYDYFRSKGRDDLWDYHSVKLPGILAAENPDMLHVLDYRALFYPLWESIERILFTDQGAQYVADFETAYAFHLWNGATEAWLGKIDDDFVRKSGSVYARIAREVLGIVPPRDGASIQSTKAQ